MKKSVMLFLVPVILLLFSSIAFAEGIGLVPIPETGACSLDNVCSTRCINGDPDCSCSVQYGYLCNANEECPGRFLKSWEGGLCCSKKCTENKLEENTGIFLPVSELNTSASGEVVASRKIRFEFTKGMQYAILTVVGVIIIFSVFASLVLHHFGDEVEAIASLLKKIKTFLASIPASLRKKFSSLKTQRKKPKEKKKSAEAKLNPLVLSIVDMLDGDEKKLFEKLLDNNGMKKDDLGKSLGFSRIKLEQMLLKLERKQLIEKKGNEENPGIFIHKWLD